MPRKAFKTVRQTKADEKYTTMNEEDDEYYLDVVMGKKAKEYDTKRVVNMLNDPRYDEPVVCSNCYRWGFPCGNCELYEPVLCPAHVEFDKVKSFNCQTYADLLYMEKEEDKLMAMHG